MSSITRKLARKAMKMAASEKAVATRAHKSIQHATTKQIIKDHGVVSEAYDNLMILFDVSVHRCFGWGEKMRGRLHAKMARHLLCLKSRMVTTPDIERILRDEAGLDLDKCHMQAENGTDRDACSTVPRTTCQRYSCCRSWMSSAIRKSGYRECTMSRRI